MNSVIRKVDHDILDIILYIQYVPHSTNKCEITN